MEDWERTGSLAAASSSSSCSLNPKRAPKRTARSTRNGSVHQCSSTQDVQVTQHALLKHWTSPVNLYHEHLRIAGCDHSYISKLKGIPVLLKLTIPEGL